MGGLGDRKPSELMDEMIALADGHHACFHFGFAFLEQLPEDLCVQLANDKFENPRELAKEADALWVANIASTSDTAMSTIHKVIQKGKAATGTGGKPTLCFHHRTFVNKAKNTGFLVCIKEKGW